MWSDRAKEEFYYAIKQAVQSGADPEQLKQELETGYYLALEDMKRSAKYTFGRK